MIFNRDNNGKFIMPKDGWYQLAPVGKMVMGERILEDGSRKQIRQKISRAGLDRMVANFERDRLQPYFPGLLIDFEHFSEDPDKSTEAAGWIEQIQNRADGLWAQIRWSDAGESAIQGGRYRGISPVWDGPEVEAGIIEPDIMFSAGLTNRPNLRGMVPLSNRQPSAPPDNQNQPNQQNSMNKIIALLGLAAGASEDVAVAEIEKIRNKAGQYDQLKTEHDALLESQAETDLNAAGITDPDKRKELKPGLINNRAATLPFLKMIKPGNEKGSEKNTPIHNREGAKTPKTDVTGEEGTTPAEQARAAKIRNRCNELRSQNPHRSFTACWAQAEAENPKE